MRKFVLLLLVSFSAFAQMDFCTSDLETFPVLAAGREKPLYVLADDSIRFITGESKVGELSATEAFCKLSLKAFGMPLELPINVKVEHVEAKKLLGLSDKDNSIPISDLENKIGLVQTKLAEIKENNSFKKELSKIGQRYSTYQAIIGAQAWTVPVEKNGQIDFIRLAEFLTEDRVTSVKEAGQNPVKILMSEAKENYLRIKGDHYLLEYKYFKWNLFVWALLCSVLAILLLFGLKNKIPGTMLTILTITLQLSGMILRILISGRAPITNMYETVMFSGLGALIISCIISLYRKEIAFVLAGLSFNVLTLMMMKFAHGMLDPGISPLVPVLRDNFWLSTHVTTVILSYAALALSWVLANSLLIRNRFFKISPEEYRYGVDLIYTAIKYGVVLLSAGVILGGVWADYSWGRFWGWDPKETWSLIVLLVYMAILHGKYTSWINPKRFVPLVAGAFLSVMMAWFGVNYILASGLHSYGFSEGGAIFLGSFFLIQIILLIITNLKSKVS
ncbi:MAG: cytochrome c biogenesis protein [Bacteriovoracaceae bacterium]